MMIGTSSLFGSYFQSSAFTSRNSSGTASKNIYVDIPMPSVRPADTRNFEGRKRPTRRAKSCFDSSSISLAEKLLLFFPPKSPPRTCLLMMM